MRYLPGDVPVIELTRRNLEVLLMKLDMPDSARTIGDPEGNIWVRAVEDMEHYSDRLPGQMLGPDGLM